MRAVVQINFNYLKNSDLDVISYLLVEQIDNAANSKAGRSLGNWASIDHNLVADMFKIPKLSIQGRLMELLANGWIEQSQDKRMYRSSMKWLELQAGEVFVKPTRENTSSNELILSEAVNELAKHTPSKVEVKNLKKTEVVEEADRIVNFFIQSRREVQPAYIINNESIERYNFRKEYAYSGRTAEQLYALIRWLYSKDSEALFWRDTISTPIGLIKHYNAVEMKYISSSKETKVMESKTKEYKFWENKGLSHEDILAKMGG